MTTVRFDASVLHSTLSRLAKLVSRKNTVPILGHVLITPRGDGCAAVQATDLDVTVTVIVSCMWAKPAPFTVELHRLRSLFKRKDRWVVLAPTKEAMSVMAWADEVSPPVTAKWGCSPLSVADFPATVVRLPDAKTSTRFTLVDGIGELLRPAPAISTEETRYYLNGICVEAGHDATSIRVTATNGHMLISSNAAVRRWKGDRKLRPCRKILPRTAIQHFDLSAKLVSVVIGDATADFDFGSVRVATKLIDGTFPEYQKVIPKAEEATKALHLPMAAMRDGIERARAFTRYGCGMRPSIGLTAKGGRVRVDAEVSVDMPMAGAGDGMIALNPDYLVSLVTLAPRAETIHLAYSPRHSHDGAGAEPILVSMDGFDGVGVIMPMRMDARHFLT